MRPTVKSENGVKLGDDAFHTLAAAVLLRRLCTLVRHHRPDRPTTDSGVVATPTTPLQDFVRGRLVRTVPSRSPRSRPV